MKSRVNLVILIIALLMFSCQEKPTRTSMQSQINITAKEILGNPDYLAMSYGGYRNVDHDIEPTIEELKEDIKLLSAMGVGILRTYKLHLPHATNVVKAIREIQEEDPSFEMYIMLGIWIDCKNAWTDQPLDHNQESPRNEEEIEKAVALANDYPEIEDVV